MSSADVPVVSIARVIRAGWLVVIVGALIGAGLGVLGWTLWPTQYQAQAVVEVADTASDSGDEINMETQAAIATSTGVLGVAVEDLDAGWTVTGLSDSLSVTVPRGAEVIELTVAATTAQAAADAANAVADAYLEDRAEVSSGAQARSLEVLEDRVSATQELLDEATSDARRLALEGRLADLEEQRADAQTALGDAGRVLSVAQPPRSPSGLSVVAWGGAGFMVGLLFGVYVATIIDRTRSQRS